MRKAIVPAADLLPTDLLAQDGQVLAFDSTTRGGLDAAFALWMNR